MWGCGVIRINISDFQSEDCGFESRQPFHIWRSSRVWSKGADCKSAAECFVGSNPTSSTKANNKGENGIMSFKKVRCIKDFYHEDQLICKKGDLVNLYVGEFYGCIVFAPNNEVSIAPKEANKHFKCKIFD